MIYGDYKCVVLKCTKILSIILTQTFNFGFNVCVIESSDNDAGFYDLMHSFTLYIEPNM
jgi:hypothetical protein